jgi:hypothetical protein
MQKTNVISAGHYNRIRNKDNTLHIRNNPCWDVIYNLQIDDSLSSNLLDCEFNLQINKEGILM